METTTSRLYGSETSLATTTPLTSNSTFRTCTSSLAATVIGTSVPSTTWTPGVFGSASATGLVIETVGGTPLLSNDS